jgi:hypothetical protein
MRCRSPLPKIFAESLRFRRWHFGPTRIGFWSIRRHTTPVATGGSPSFSGGASFVSVMETADLWNRYDSSELWRLDCPRFRRVLTQREVCSGFVIVRHKRPHMPMQRGFVEDNQVIQTLAPNRSDHALDVRALPGRSWRRQHFPDAHFPRPVW